MNPCNIGCDAYIHNHVIEFHKHTYWLGTLISVPRIIKMDQLTYLRNC